MHPAAGGAPSAPADAGGGGGGDQLMAALERRRRVIDEIVSTERTHVLSLRAVVACFIAPARARRVLTADELWRLFSTWELLVGFHEAQRRR